MTRENEQQDRPIDQRMIERLVDGELLESDRRKVLAALEADPGGWRRCALAFLEDQELSRILPQLSEAKEGSPAKMVSRPVGTSRWTGVLALAATAFFAFVLGLRSNSWMPGSDTPANSSRSSAEMVAESVEPSASAQFVSRPANNASDLTIADLLKGPSIIPADLRRELELSGITVQSHRGLVPGTRSDGSPILIPYEEVEVVPVNRLTH